MRRILLTYCLIIITCSLVFTQNSERIDSLILRLESPMHDTSKVNLLNELAEEYLYIDPERIYDYAIHALELSENNDFKKGIAISYNNLGTYFRVRGIYQEAMDYYFKSLEIMEELNDKEGIARCYNLIGILYFFLENFNVSLDYYMKALEINYQQNDRKWIAGNSNNVGMIYERKGEYEKALEYYLKSLEMNIELGYKNWIANNYGNIGSLYQLLDNPLSIDYFKRRLQINVEQNDLYGTALSNQLIGNYYLGKQDYKRALPYLQKAFELAQQSNFSTLLERSSQKLSEAYEGIRDFENAYQYEKIFKQYNDSLDLAANTEKITRLQMQYQYKKDKHMKELEFEKDKLVQNIIAVSLFFLLLFIFMVYSRQRTKSNQQKLLQQKLTLDNNLLIEELSFKDKMLQDNIRYLLSKNEILTTTIESLNDLKHKSKPENHKIIFDLILELRTGITDETREEFEIRFKEIHNNYYQKLTRQYPDLSSNEKKLCAFLRLNMTSKEISAITNQSAKSIETARSRLRKKLKIENSTQSLSEFLNKI